MHPPRLSRLDRIFTDQLFYFLTFCTYNRVPILAQPYIHQAFRSFTEASTTRGAFVGRYVIMPDHIHLFAAFDEKTSMAAWIKSLKNYLSKALRESNIEAPHWQKGYFDHLLRSEESYGSKWEYIFHNPVRHQLVSKPSLWPFQGEINPLTFT
jgi:putative transposase